MSHLPRLRRRFRRQTSTLLHQDRTYRPFSSPSIHLRCPRLPRTLWTIPRCKIHPSPISYPLLQLADFLARRGFIVHLIDLRGFGYSGGPRSNGTIAEFHKDIEVMLKQAKSSLPLYLLGHGFGASLILSLCSMNPELELAGVVLLSPLLRAPRDRSINFWKIEALRFLGDECDDIIINLMKNATGLTRDNYEVKKILDDKLSNSFIGLRLAKNIFEVTEFIRSKAQKFYKPVLLVHGTEDILCDSTETVRFYDAISAEDKTLKIMEGGFHELHHDLEKETLKSTIFNWLSKRLPTAPAFGIPPSKIKGGYRYKYFRDKIILFLRIVCLLIYLLFLRRAKRDARFNTKAKLFFYPLVWVYYSLFS
eukprot:TRINITY_DN4631_c0_g2_i2.p1 TRINITY_DN4631_c0_g2~~TRINITY_DN4631_c0_g2_i2.p1  ORF type:complete len:365 (-),score=62.08 TRINITY_DN4631_c0_g2_i2:66-1160(-)